MYKSGLQKLLHSIKCPIQFFFFLHAMYNSVHFTFGTYIFTQSGVAFHLIDNGFTKRTNYIVANTFLNLPFQNILLYSTTKFD
jgi:hypothetical protein